jgi:hypothetical protein
VSRAKRRHRKNHLDELRQEAMGCEDEVWICGDANHLGGKPIIQHFYGF